MWRAAVLYLFFLLVGCSKPPQVPSLDRLENPGPSRIILDDHLSPEDLREIFRALNRNGKLSSLRPYFEEATDSELTDVSGLFSKYFYEEANRRDGLLSLLETRIRNRGFSRLYERAREWSSSPSYRAEVDVLTALVSYDGFPELLEKDSGFIHPSWTSLLKDTWLRADAQYVERERWETGPHLSAEMAHHSVRKILDTEHIRLTLVALLGSLDEREFGTNLLRAMATLRHRKGLAAFEGMSRGLALMLPGTGSSENKLQRLLSFMQTADSPTNGLFSAIADKIRRDPVTLNGIGALFQPISARGAAGYAREILSAPRDENRFFGKEFWQSLPDRVEGRPSPAFLDLFRAVSAAGERITENQAIIVPNTYALTRWLEETVKLSRETEEWKRAPAKDFHQNIWALTVESAELTIDLSDPAARRELETLGFSITDTSPSYRFERRSGDTLRKALDGAFLSVDEARNYTDVAGFIRAFAFPLTRPSDRAFFSLRELETPSLLDSMNRFLLGMETETWTRIDRILFDEMQLHALSSEESQRLRTLILDFYDRAPDLSAKASRLLDDFSMIHEFSVPVRGLPAPFDAYHALLRSTRSEDISSVSQLFSLLGEAGFFAYSGSPPVPEFPAFIEAIKNGRYLGKLLFGLSLINPRQHETFLRPFEGLIDDGPGLERHFTLFDHLERRSPPGFRALLGRFSPEALIENLDGMPVGERLFATRVIAESDHQVVWRFFRAHASRDQLKRFVREVRALGLSGSLRDAFQLLTQLENERLRRIGRVLSEWHSSGELAAFLNTIDIALGL